MTSALLYLSEDAEEFAAVSDKFAASAPADMAPGTLEEFRAMLALRHTPGLGVRSIIKLLKYYGGAREAASQCAGWRRAGIADNCARNFAGKLWRAPAEKEWKAAFASDALVLLWTGAEYPALLRQLPDAPVLFYCRGDLSLLRSPCVAVVGSRNPTAHSEVVAVTLGDALSSSGITVVSGMAAGIDRQAHAGALRGVGKSIGVLGTGIEMRYPRSNSDLFAVMLEEGLLLSEFAPYAAPASSNFPIRNRIISGLSLGVVVVEAAARSGSLITARYAIDQNREVFAVPGAAMSSQAQGCQNLVRQGAKAVFCAEDIIADLQAQLRPYGIEAAESGGRTASVAAPVNLPEPSRNSGQSPDKRKIQSSAPLDANAQSASDMLLGNGAGDIILKLLQENGPLHMDVLAEKAGISSGELSAAILGLEMAGQIERLPGAYFEIAL